MSKNDDIKSADVAFVVDTTGSMGSFIRAAQTHIKTMMAMFEKERGLDLRVALIEYRDHKPEEHTFVTKINKFTDNIDIFNNQLNAMHINGGGDAPEAVYDGVQDAASLLEWRDGSMKIIILVGDAPPHGGLAHDGANLEKNRWANWYGDKWAKNYPPNTSGSNNLKSINLHTCTAAAEEIGATIYAICVSGDSSAMEAFKEICEMTSGKAYSAQDGVKAIQEIGAALSCQFDLMDIDEKVNSLIDEYGDNYEAISAATGLGYSDVVSSSYRLKTRGIRK